MTWLELKGGAFRIGFRYGGRKHHFQLKTDDRKALGVLDDRVVPLLLTPVALAGLRGHAAPGELVVAARSNTPATASCNSFWLPITHECLRGRRIGGVSLDTSPTIVAEVPRLPPRRTVERGSYPSDNSEGQRGDAIDN